MRIINGNIYMPDYQFHRGNIFTKNQWIEDITVAHHIAETSKTSEICLDATDCYVIPGLIDIHFHGCAGADFCDGTSDALHRIAAYQASQGITGICPASMTLSPDTLEQLMENASEYHALQNSLHKSNSETACADLLGIHLEGPFLCANKKGAQNADFLRTPDIPLFQKLQDKAQGLIRIVDIAPEEDANYQFIHSASQNTVVSIAHTEADYNTCMNAFAAGATHVTHLFNAMPPFSHRAPGPIGAAFDTPGCNVELICDGIHASPSAIRMTFQLFTDNRIILISDSMRATGMPDGNYSLGGQKVIVRTTPTINNSAQKAAASTIATLSDGTIAGSVTHLMDCVRKAVSFGIPLESALRCATANPAKCIGVWDRLGFLKPGYIANVVILDSKLQIKHVILHGKCIS